MEINFQIKGIELLKCTLVTPESAAPAPSYVYNIVVEHKAVFDKKLLFVIVSVDIKLDADSEIIGNVSASCYYEIENFEDVVKLNDTELLIDSDFANTINSISISTVRGIIYSTFKGTYLHNTVLPVFSPLKLQVQK